MRTNCSFFSGDSETLVIDGELNFILACTSWYIVNIVESKFITYSSWEFKCTPGPPFVFGAWTYRHRTLEISHFPDGSSQDYLISNLWRFSRTPFARELSVLKRFRKRKKTFAPRRSDSLNTGIQEEVLCKSWEYSCRGFQTRNY